MRTGKVFTFAYAFSKIEKVEDSRMHYAIGLFANYGKKSPVVKLSEIVEKLKTHDFDARNQMISKYHKKGFHSGELVKKTDHGIGEKLRLIDLSCTYDII